MVEINCTLKMSDVLYTSMWHFLYYHQKAKIKSQRKTKPKLRWNTSGYVASKNAIFSFATPEAPEMTHWKLDVTWRCHRCSAVFTAAGNGHAMRSRQISQKQMRARSLDERDWWRRGFQGRYKITARNSLKL